MSFISGVIVFVANQVEVTKCVVPSKRACQGLSRQKVSYTIEVNLGRWIIPFDVMTDEVINNDFIGIQLGL